MTVKENQKLSIQTCYSPALYDLFHEDESIVVAVDILRATSAICTAFEHGVKSMIPVAGLDEAYAYKKKGYLVAAERNAVKQDGVDYGNSPLHYIDASIEGKTIVISTTNGTQAIEAAKGKATIVIGSFLNITTLSEWLKKQNRNIIVLCAGWKNKFNMEDSLFAGALSEKLLQDERFYSLCDSTIAACYLYEQAANDLYGFLEKSSHRHRLKNLDLEDDVRFCLQQDIYSSIPILNGNELIKLQAQPQTV